MVEIEYAAKEHPADTRSTSLQRLGLSLFGAMALVSLVVAGATAWLVLANPVTVANAVSEGDLSLFVRDLARVLRAAFGALLWISDGPVAPGTTSVSFLGESVVRIPGVLEAAPLVLAVLGLRVLGSRMPWRALFAGRMPGRSKAHVE